ncbi:hypothetical protein B296_00028232 [Ensete ventricosum]|uniref:Uncharacterized protein n=1 Tax=Ensete ventricosum TaxID=4639 RepID=A0A426XLT1_ENSVE|nr:hypothetical protein B296_00028232 [Ensete ventricosum]
MLVRGCRGCSGQGDGRIRLRLRRRKATAARRVVVVTEGEAAQQQRAQLEARVVRRSRRQQRQRCYGEMAAVGNDYCAAAGCSGRGEKEADEAAAAVEVVGKIRRQRPMMGGSGRWRPKLATAA